MHRRLLLAAGLGAGLSWAGSASAARATSAPLRIGADLALADSGLAAALQRSFMRDTGLAVQIVASPALTLLDALAGGELDVALSNAPAAEAKLGDQGLLHDRQPIASGAFVLIGPAPKKGVPPLLKKAETARVGDALAALAAEATRQGDALVFLTPNDGSGAHVAEQAAWRAASVAPQAPWYAAATADSGLIAQARARRAYALVERGAWFAQGGGPLALLVDGDASLVEDVHAMRSFRSPHPAGRLFVGWIAGPRGRAVVAAQRGYRPAVS